MSIEKLCFVSPRYGEEIIGGAEFAIRRLAENCVLHGGIDAEVLTTTAGDERTWSKKYDQGDSRLNGVTVKRFYNEPIDRLEFDSWAKSLIENPSVVSEKQFDEWLTRQGPYSPELLDAIEDTDADAVVFHPMLSSPTSHGVFRSAKPVVIHPALHNEPLSFMPGYAEVMKHADLLAFSTRSEQQLAQEIYGAIPNRQSVIGFGIEGFPQISESDQKNIIEKFGLDKRRYFVVIGRVDPGKGSDLVAEMFMQSQNALTPDIKLVFIGPISPTSKVASMQYSNIICTGTVSEEEKYALLSNSVALINPSATESFSLVVLEAMKCGIPVLVNAACGPTVEHVMNSGAGISFSSFLEFISALGVLSRDHKIWNSCSENGSPYIKSKYEWKTVISKYIRMVGQVCP